jgi:V/A-type H+-transporting ATPase subunit I
MSLFYVVIFGLMFADVGYGLLTVLACFGGVALLKPREGMKRFLLMFGYCGISCIAMGVVFGGYFGDFPSALMENMFGVTIAEVALWFNPVAEPLTFLVVALAAGAIHLIGGMAVQFYVLCKRGQVFAAIFDIGSWWVLFAGIGVFVLAGPTPGFIVAGTGAAMLILTQGRHEKNVVMKFLKGLYAIYGIINYVSDLLSYCRILALGLAASVIAEVFNLLSMMAGPTVVGYVMMVVVFCIGHALNLAINLLGTFVHTSRLQYIEFFGKFFEDGGQKFEPMAPSAKYTLDR